MACRREIGLTALRWIPALFMITFQIVLCGFETEAAPIIPEKTTVHYSSQLGYPPPVRPSTEESMQSEALSKEISKLQSLMGINVTGNMNAETAGLMKLPRCGVDDKDGPRNSGRKKRYVLEGYRWVNKNLTYRISKYSEKLTRQEVDNEIARAFAVWSEHTDLKFTPKLGKVDIDIRFERKYHGDGNPFDGNDGDINILAHAFNLGGDRAGHIHFDDDENWTLHSSHGQNLFETAVHEIGHALGLDHSEIGSSAMTPILKPYNPNYKLDEDDIQGIQKLYGPTRHDGPDICTDPKIDAMFQFTEGNIFVFKGNYYWEIMSNKIVSSNPRLIAETWKELPGDIDAAVMDANGKTYFFKGSMYWRYIGVKIDGDYPRRIIEGFPTIPDNLDAAGIWPEGDNKMHFHKGNEYWISAAVQEANKSSLISNNPEFIPVERTYWDDSIAEYLYYFHISSLQEVLDLVLRAENCRFLPISTAHLF